MNSSPRTALGIILLVALALRVGWATHQPVSNASIDSLPDQREYLELGRNLLAGRGLQFVDPRFDQTVWAYRTPGYPLLIAACGGNVLAVRVAQSVLDTSTVLAVFLLARRWLAAPQSLFAAVMAAVHPLLIYFSSLILSETLFVAMLTWGIVLWVYGGKKIYLGAAMLALAVLVRPSALALPLILAVLARRRSVPLIAASAVMTIAVLFPWALRNHQTLGTWIWTSTNSGITKYDGFNPGANGGSDQSFITNMPELRHMGEVERSDYLSRRADEFIRENPAAVVRLAVQKIARMWSPIPLSREFSRPLYIAVGLVYSLPLFLLALAGLIGSGLTPRAKILLAGPAIYFTIIHAASVSSLRYRLPAEPPIIVLAAATFAGRKSS